MDFYLTRRAAGGGAHRARPGSGADRLARDYCPFCGHLGRGPVAIAKMGRADLARLRQALAREGIHAIRLETSGVASVLGGILLVFLGFITDALGAALLVPTLRRWAAGKVAATAPRPRRGRGDRLIDLEPGEWHRIPDRRRGRRRRAKGEA